MKDNETKKLSLEELTTKIKDLIRTSALAKIEIGELLNEHTSAIKRGGKEAFYKSIGMSDRTAQHYMKIASNEEVQKLKADEKLGGLNMTKVLELAGIRTQERKKAEKVDYITVPVESFDYNSCKSTKILKTQYGLLSNKVTELEAKLAKYEAKPTIKAAV